MPAAEGLCAQRELTIAGPAGTLQALLECPAGPPAATAAIICHPHPLYGGTFDNKVVHTLARAFTGLGAASVRFNFRGVGHSSGHFDHGLGESADLAAVARWVRDTLRPQNLWLAGFSFGAYVALRSHLQIAPQRLILVAPPIRYCQNTEDCLLGSLPALVVQGAQDTVVTPRSVEDWLRAQMYPPDYQVLEAEHFFHGRLGELKKVVSAWCREH